MSLDLMEEVRCCICLLWGGAENGGKEWVGGLQHEMAGWRLH